jgi:hypothetical protein
MDFNDANYFFSIRKKGRGEVKNPQNPQIFPPFNPKDFENPSRNSQIFPSFNPKISQNLQKSSNFFPI